ncbi:glycosyl hydrolase [Pedobacter sp. L105]|uniref:glycosyl hydrolase n=1 Tax=Pedobacter sp. L105 TaxID=1641871 RepID=UPI00131CD455|nr:glycosyl hydrolase [Pedobacter sp. L105]
MMKILFAFTFLLLISISTPSIAQSELKAGFSNPPASAKAETWWHWLDGNVSKTGITSDLEAMKRVGIEKAEIFNVSSDYPQGPCLYMSKEWLDMVYFAAIEAKRLNMHLGFHNSAGWSSSGGPWIKPEFAMQTVVYSQTQLKTGIKFDHRLPQPLTKFNYYKDIAVLAFPTPKGNFRIHDLELKSLSGNLFKTNVEPEKRHVPDSASIARSTIIDLTSKLSANGELNWNPPAGEWTILRIGHTPNGTENHPAVAGGKGLECDKMSSTALDAYWAGGVKPILDKLGPLAGLVVTDCLVDSYEVGCNNWTSAFREEFKKRRGYDCLTDLPTLAGYYVESNDATERFLWDFRKTIGDLIADKYYGHFSELCHANKLNFCVEPYGGPFDSHASGSRADVVMGEFWLTKQLFLESPRMAASIAHIYGIPVAGAESFTGFGGWTNFPATMKPVGDKVWAEGINRFIFHSYVHQPWNYAPGLTMGGYGIELNRMNTWWEQSKPYFAYVARSQFLLQQGHSVADVLVFTGESEPNNGIIRTDIKNTGYDYDQIGADAFYSLKVINGQLFTPHSGPYKMLVLPDTKWATPELLLKVKSLVDAGAMVAGSQPEKSPSLLGYPQCDSQVSKLASELWTEKIKSKTSAADIAHFLSDAHVPPDFGASGTGSDLIFIHRIYDNKDIYFVANPQNFARTESCRFRISGKVPELWDPETGLITDIPVWKQLPGNIIEIPVSFSSHESVFVVFNKSADLNTHFTQVSYKIESQKAKPLPGLRIVKAEYGKFLPEGIVDVTPVVNNKISKNGLHFSAGNWLSASDPAPGSLKELRLLYYINGQTHTATLLENEESNLSEDTTGFKLVRALYGKFGSDFNEIPVDNPVYNVKDKIKELVKSGRYTFIVTDSLFNETSNVKDKENELHLTYETDNESFDLEAGNGHKVILEEQQPKPKLSYANNTITLLTPSPVKFTYLTNLGERKSVAVQKVSGPINITGPWNVTFSRIREQRIDTTFKRLTSWSLCSSGYIRYFSGTATYKKDIVLQKDLLRPDNLVELDLGSVREMAQVFLNGKDLGILWKAPFTMEIGKYLHAGTNHLEIKVTNLWKNRLIGDERFPDDQRTNNENKWPDWILDSTIHRNSKRMAFTSHKYYNKDSELQLSGLLGPVVLRSYKRIKITNTR